MGWGKRCEIKRHPPHEGEQCPLCVEGVEECGCLLPSIVAAWVLVGVALVVAFCRG